ncbi:cytochrome c3 family protein [Shewanella schlegeliana]|uniref:Cytochrome C n=1 Tax=Shewanella schlegeliana TaxID=190308 RepID=A0ABS1SXE6_9GAMM|nr:cytochrome C [Shewanella schlegeliana]MBL4912665.1 cytochrome C [Shewanella schlegeliana]MCL1109825.1 cytochrome c3 family protein [Shewanella schlegeliana]GIU32837.1 cytochrome c [Shewanella schlegeliana]
MSIDRRQALTKIIGLSTAAAGAALVGTSAFAATDADGNYRLEMGETLKYVPLDAMATAKLAYETGGGCMHQVFHSIVTMLAKSNSVDAEKFATIPTALAGYGWAGIVGQGTICGNLNAAGMLINILGDINGQNSAVIGATFRYYETQDLPLSSDEFVAGIGSTAEKSLEVGATSIANSPLCHSSISNWSAASGKVFKEKGERCKRLSASLAYHIVELLNRAHGGEDISLLPEAKPSAEAQACQSCHGVTETMGPAASVKTDMECTTCHTGHFN